MEVIMIQTTIKIVQLVEKVSFFFSFIFSSLNQSRLSEEQKNLQEKWMS